MSYEIHDMEGVNDENGPKRCETHRLGHLVSFFLFFLHFNNILLILYLIFNVYIRDLLQLGLTLALHMFNVSTILHLSSISSPCPPELNKQPLINAKCQMWMKQSISAQRSMIARMPVIKRKEWKSSRKVELKSKFFFSHFTIFNTPMTSTVVFYRKLHTAASRKGMSNTHLRWVQKKKNSPPIPISDLTIVPSAQRSMCSRTVVLV